MFVGIDVRVKWLLMKCSLQSNAEFLNHDFHCTFKNFIAYFPKCCKHIKIMGFHVIFPNYL